MNRISIWMVLLVFGFSILLGTTSSWSKGILFQEDFESGDIDKKVWQPTGNWKTEDSKGVKGLGKHVLNIVGGEAGISVQNDFDDFEYYCDFQAMAGGLTGFVFRAQDTANNFYMHQISVTGSGHTPNNMRWHWKVGGNWNVEPIPFMNGVTLEMNTWYHTHWIIEDYDFKVFIVEKEKEGKTDMTLIGDWTDKGKNYQKGALGFRSSGGEAMEYDNILVVPLGWKQAVQPEAKLPTFWAKIKTD